MTFKKAYRQYNYLILIVPALLLYAVFIAYPFFSSLFLSFFKWPGIGPKIFVGLDNYKNVLTGYMSREFYRALGHNFYFLFLNWTLSIVPGIILALSLAAGLKGSDIFKTIFFIPNTLSIVIVGFLWALLLNPQWGMINQVLKAVGLDALAKPWLGDTKLALPTIIVVTGWRGMGFYVLTFLAAVVGIDRSMLEAGRIDGARESQIVFKLVLPQMIPIITTVTILKIIWSFNIFDIVFAMEGTQGGPAGSTDVLGTLFYRIAFGGLGSSQVGMGLGATVVTLIFLIVFPVSVLYIYIIEKREVRG